jgi:phospholipase/carboxylesterase
MKPFIHIFEPGETSSPVLLLLHGTGGDEHDLLDLGRAVAPQAGILSVRGNVLENGMPRFFKRLAEGVFDQDDLRLRTTELADFLTEARQHYDWGNRPVYALSFSNGANIASSLLLSHPDVLSGAALLRGMLPFEPQDLPDLSKHAIVMLNGLMDPIVPVDQPTRLVELFKQAGATVELIMKPVSHNLVQSDLNDLKAWWQSLNAVS